MFAFMYNVPGYIISSKDTTCFLSIRLWEMNVANGCLTSRNVVDRCVVTGVVVARGLMSLSDSASRGHLGRGRAYRWSGVRVSRSRLSGGSEFVVVFLVSFNVWRTELADLKTKSCWVNIPVSIDKSCAEDLAELSVFVSSI